MRPLKKFVLVVTPFGLAACASVLGFEDAKDRSDASTDGGGPISEGNVVASNIAGIVCAPRAPQGWQGPLALFTATGSSLPDPPACAPQYAKVFDGKGEPAAPSGECRCECDPSTTKACEGPTITFFTDNLCTKTCAGPQPVANFSATAPQCATVDRTGCPTTDTGWAKATAAHPGGSCTPKTIGTPPPLTWGSVARLCEPEKNLGAQCDADKAPAPETKFPYQTDNYCIATTIADAVCPSTYATKHVFYNPDTFNDSRGCNDCSCGAPKGNCGGQVHGADNGADCSGGEDFLKPLPSPCIEVKKSPTFAYEPGPAGNVNATCDPGGGGAKGSFTATAPTTVCCRF